MTMSDKFRQLSALGAGDFVHLNGSLIDHLQGTQNLLKAWSASAPLQDAGLYHAAYGTDGYSEALVSPRQRARISQIIGAHAEEIVYLYCACDRKFVWPQFGERAMPEFKNRFTGELVVMGEQQLRDFCELTVANEIELAIDQPAFVQAHGSTLYSLFKKMAPYLTAFVRESTEGVFGRGAKLIAPSP